MDFKQLSTTFKEYWMPLFTSMNIGVSAPFSVKVFYYPKDDPGNLSVRFWANELNNKNGLYVEPSTMEGLYFHPEYRSLYKLQYDKDWESKPDIYRKTMSNSGGITSYIVNVEYLLHINSSPSKSLFPVIETGITEIEILPSLDTLNQDLFKELNDKLEDDRYTAMTLRDIYCMLQNVPLSNKQWLNNLINEGIKFKQNE